MYHCGIDVGGTKILAVLIDESGAVVARHKLKVRSDGLPKLF
jgi:predicted NBD/HSP70 family sugar kinase